MKMYSGTEVDFVIEAIKGAVTELQMIEFDNDWFVSQVIDDLDEALAILQDKDVNDESTMLGSGDERS